MPKERDPRLVTIHRGGTLTDDDHRLLAWWAAECAAHVLHYFEESVPGDDRPRQAIAAIRAWIRQETTWQHARMAAFAANAAARELKDPARSAAYAAGQAGAVGHVPEHDLGAAAYAIRAVGAAAPKDERDEARRAERDWQRARLPEGIRQLVIEDEARRNDICWGVFAD
jgi:hypothetical protein